ncbi:Polysaccharide biosynthesis/export protein [Ruegeria meonggei]|uniref:Polysaccharide biosynthesis/export protein n=1 Tax=Ruegeria meonggei TaxID=1446476 RepID=A0A1X7ACX7_9RHOB|nr:Polysaccharide biosynthesis/export protein [Ruegeria meonggei]
MRNFRCKSAAGRRNQKNDGLFCIIEGNINKVKDELDMHTVIKSFLIFVAAVVAATSAFAQSSYRIQPGDALQVEVLEDASLNRTVLVLPDGSFSFPLVGSVQASGRTTNTVQSALSSSLASNFNTPPTVFVSIASLSQGAGAASSSQQAMDVFVMGEVVTPGKIATAPGTTILQILAEAGGFTRFAAQKRVELRRTDKKSGTVNKFLYNYKGTGSGINGSTVLKSGDVIVVPARRLFE